MQASRYQDPFSAPIPSQDYSSAGRGTSATAAAVAAENEREKERSSKIGKEFCIGAILHLGNPSHYFLCAFH